MIYNEDDRAQRLLDVFDILPGQVNVSYVNNTSHIVAWHKHNLQTDYWVCIKGSFKVGLATVEDGCKFEYLSDKNPKVLEISEEIINNNEGCLSFPGLYLKVKRSSKIKVEYTGEDGKVVQVELTGLTARCYLHELDHMNGVKFTDYVGPIALKIAKEKQQKRIKKHTRMGKK